jgi:hypothetical protein
MNFMINLDDYKNIKKLEIVYKDLIVIRERLTASLELLKEFNSKYIHVQECVSVLHNSRTIIEININKYKKVLGK